jgi:hypothetical protein
MSPTELTKVRDALARALSVEAVNQLGRDTGQAVRLRIVTPHRLFLAVVSVLASSGGSPSAGLPQSDPFARAGDRAQTGLFITRVIGGLCALAGFSMLTAAIPVAMMAATLGGLSRTAAWVGVALLASGLVTLFVSARPVGWLESARQTSHAGRPDFGGWLWVLAVTLAILPLWMIVRLIPLLTLWTDMLALLDAQGVWNLLEGGGDLSGIVLVPVFGVLSVPAFEMAVAVSVVIHGLLLFTLLVMTRPRFARAFLAFAVLHVGLAISVQLAVAAALDAGRFVESALEDSPEREEAVAAITRYGEVLKGSSRILTMTIAGLVVWTPGVFLSRRLPATFADAA